MPSFLNVDWCYPQFLWHAEESMPEGSYETGLKWILAYRFGTSDFYTRHLRNLGWEAHELIANAGGLMERWRAERKVKWISEAATVLSVIDDIKPDVVCLQSVHGLPKHVLEEVRRKVHILVGFCSYDTDRDWFSRLDVVFTSFPHYIDKIKTTGTRAELLPLSFEPSVIEEAGDSAYGRDINCSFVGGLGIDRIWKRGGEILSEVASKISGFRAYGYGGKSLPDSALKHAWYGEAWGLDMFRVYSRSKIVVNRHGEIASGYANNMRMYEATGCGAALVTEDAPNLSKLFKVGVEVETYRSPSECIDKIKDLLADDKRRVEIASAGHARTLKSHRYEDRVKILDAVLREELGRK